MGQDEDLAPPKADFSAPPPYELVTSLPHAQQMHANTTESHENNFLPVPLNNTTTTNNTNPVLSCAEHPAIASQQPHQHVVDMEQQHGGNTNVTAGEPVSPPPMPTKLPTYAEVQMEKSRLGEMPMDLQNTFPTVHGRIPPPSHPVLISALRNAHAQQAGSVAVGPNGTLTFIGFESADSQGHGRHHATSVGGGSGLNAGGTAINVDNSLLGTDFMFLSAFIIAFLFNWIGFLMLTCFFHTIAARYGALSGFGLSLAKWTLIVKKSTDLASHESSWLWWLIMSFGCLICVRALIQYISIKKTWRMLSASAQERLLFFY